MTSRAVIDDSLTTLQSAVAATGNGDSLSVKGWAAVVVAVTGTFTATVTFEQTVDGSNWVAAQSVNAATGAAGTTATAAGVFLVAVPGAEYFRTRVTWTSGTSVTTKVRALPFDAAVVNSVSGAGETVTANQGSAGASAWPVKGAGTAGTADTGVVTVQGIASGTAQPVSSTTLATVAKQPALGVDGTPSADVISVQGPITLAANVISGAILQTSSSGPTTLITVPAGRVWRGVVGANCACTSAAASATSGQAEVQFNTAGTGVVPTAGLVFSCVARSGANAATGTVGSQGNNSGSTPMTIIAPVGNSVTLTWQTFQAGTNSHASIYAHGVLL